MKMKFAFEALGIAVLVVTALTPLASLIAFRVGAVAHPGGRHVHVRAIPRLGGVGICIAFMVPLFGIWLFEPALAQRFTELPYKWAGLVGGAVVMCVVGVVDDTRGIRALHKLYAQIAVAVVAYASGFTIHMMHLPIVGEVSMGVFALPVTVLWIVGVINAVNLIDGLDGLAAGVVFFAAATNFVVAYVTDNAAVALLSGATAGAVLGFLFYNFNPARIFMGDSGSYFLGYILAVTSLIGASQKASTAVSLLVPVVALGVPIFDTLFAMVRRIIERRPMFSSDRGHIHHRLLDMGVTHRRAVLILYGACVLLTIAAIGISLGRSWQVGGAMLGASVVLVGVIRFGGDFESLHLRSRQKARIRARDAEMLRFATPNALGRFAEARSEVELFDALEVFAKEADLQLVEVSDTTQPEEREVFRWGDTGEPGDPQRMSAARDVVAARYPIGRDGVARAAIKFAWQSDYGGDVAPQAEILLQVTADVLGTNLTRLRSALAPSPAAATVAVSESEHPPASAPLGAGHSGS